MQFKDIPGLEEIKQRLILTVKDNRISHAQLFYGEEGSAALSLAMAYAQYITCNNRTEDDSCGQCASCQQSDKLVHPDILFSFPVVKTAAGSNDTISIMYIEKWREIIRENSYIGPGQWYEHLGVENKQGVIYTEESNEIIRKLSLKAFESEYKILIQWLPEKMHKSAANRLLKLIEEPPEKTVFLFVSIEPDQILPTILSRCQSIKIPKIAPEKMEIFLQNRYHLQGDELRQVLRRADGNMLEAVEFIRNREAENAYLQLFIRWMRLSYALNIPEILNWVDKMTALGRERQKAFLKYVMYMTRENFMLHIFHGRQMTTQMTKEELDFSARFSDFIHENNIEELYNLINQAYYHIMSNAYHKIVFLDVSLKLNKLLKK